MNQQQRKSYANLQIQAMMFDMDIDLENATLTQKVKPYQVPFWLKKWKEKEDGKDFTNIDNGF